MAQASHFCVNIEKSIERNVVEENNLLFLIHYIFDNKENLYK